MLLELFLALFIGILAGSIAGLIPGIHINLVGVSLASILLFLGLQIEPVYLVVFIVSMAISQTFVDFIPSIFVGAPEDGTELSVLPGHELLKKGLGFEAVALTCYGGLAAIAVLAAVSFPLLFVSKNLFVSIYEGITPFIPGLLVLSSFYLISKESKKAMALGIFVLSGILGLSVLNISSLNQPLLPLLSGLFGGSAMILSIKSKTSIPPQKISTPKENIFKPLIGAIIASPLCGFLPGLGGGQAAIIGNTISKTGRKGFLVLVGATNTLVMGISFVALFLLSKTRTGAAVFIREVIGNPSRGMLFIIIIITVVASGIISYYLTIWLAKTAISTIQKINYFRLTLSILILLAIIIFFISGFFGLIVFLISTLFGIYAITSGVRRTNMMGCLIIPTIILYLF